MTTYESMGIALRKVGDIDRVKVCFAEAEKLARNRGVPLLYVAARNGDAVETERLPGTP